MFSSAKFPLFCSGRDTIAHSDVEGAKHLPNGTQAAVGDVVAMGADQKARWTPLSGVSVSSVFGRTGAVTAQPGDYTAAQVGAAAASHVHDAASITTGVLDVARIPVLPSQIQVASSGDLTALTTGQQAQIGQGTIVTTTDGFRWVYTGAGSKTVYSSYITLADVTPDWSAIANKPSLEPALGAPEATAFLRSDSTGLRYWVALTLQFLYDISSQIVTSATRGAFTLKRGSAADTDDVLAIKNGAGTKTASVAGNGYAKYQHLEVGDVFGSGGNGTGIFYTGYNVSGVGFGGIYLNSAGAPYIAAPSGQVARVDVGGTRIAEISASGLDVSGAVTAGSVSAPLHTFGGYAISEGNSATPVGDGDVVICSASRIRGWMELRWSASNREETVFVYTAAGQFDATGASIQILGRYSYQDYGSISGLKLMLSSDGATVYLVATLADRNSGLTPIRCLYSGTDPIAYGGSMPAGGSTIKTLALETSGVRVSSLGSQDLAGTGTRAVAADSTGKLVVSSRGFLWSDAAKDFNASSSNLTMLSASSGQRKIPANTWTAGKVLQLKIQAIISSSYDGSSYTTFQFFIGPDGSYISPYYMNVNTERTLAPGQWSLASTVTIRCVSAGASGVFYCTYDTTISNATGTTSYRDVGSDQMGGNLNIINTTVDRYIDFTEQAVNTNIYGVTSSAEWIA